MSEEAVTRDIRVRVTCEFQPERSAPQLGRWFFAYRINISNEGMGAVQLISRNWIICNANGEVTHVNGPGVIGKQPVLDPGSEFEYTSGCPLETPFGSMRGTYQMVTAEGERFEVAIPAFALRMPGTMS